MKVDVRNPGGTEAPDIIQFSSVVYYCTEEEGFVEVEIVRLGNDDNHCSVQYATQDVSAKAGKKYIPRQGRVEFDAGEFKKSIPIELIGNNAFEATLQFEVVLSDAKGATIGATLRKCNVLIADDDFFPTNKYKQAILEGRLRTLSGWGLMREYIRMALSDSKIRSAARVCFFADQISNLLYLWNIEMARLVVDVLLQPLDPATIDWYWYESLIPKSDMGKLSLWACLVLVSHVIRLLLYRIKANTKLGSLAMNQLQANLLRKYLNYNEVSRAMVSTSDLTMAITRDVPELVKNGFMRFFGVMQALGLVVILGISAMLNSDKEKLWSTIVLFFAIPGAMFVFVAACNAETQRRNQVLFKGQTSSLTLIYQVTDCVRLITDYCQLPQTVIAFEERMGVVNAANTDCLLWRNTVSEYAPFLTTCAVILYTVFNYRAVVDGQVPIGAFIAGTAVWKGVGKSYQTVYSEVIFMQSAVAPLLNVVHYMNCAVDTLDRLDMKRKQLAQSHQASGRAQSQLFQGVPAQMQCVSDTNVVQRGKSVAPAVYAQDLMMIIGSNVTFAYPASRSGGAKLLDHASFKIRQGTLVSVFGGRGTGKKTLLELISSVQLPHASDDCTVFVPPHLQLLHVTKEPQQLLELDIFQNLRFGCMKEDGEITRVLNICRKMGLSEGTLKLVQDAARTANPDDFVATKTATKRSQSARQSLDSINEVGKQISADTVGTSDSVVKRTMQEELCTSAVTNLPFTEKCLLHIARAFVANPHVLVLHKPLEHFNTLMSQRIVDLLREFVDNRGLEKPAETFSTRRPRTVIFSVENVESLGQADMLYEIKDGQVNLMDLESCTTIHSEVTKLCHILDSDGDDLLSLDDFCSMISLSPDHIGLFGVSVSTPEKEKRTAMEALFYVIDAGGNGKVDKGELLNFMKESFDYRMEHLAAALKCPKGILVQRLEANKPATIAGMAWEDIDKWNAPAIPEDAKLPMTSVSPHCRRPENGYNPTLF